MSIGGGQWVLIGNWNTVYISLSLVRRYDSVRVLLHECRRKRKVNVGHVG